MVNAIHTLERTDLEKRKRKIAREKKQAKKGDIQATDRKTIN